MTQPGPSDSEHKENTNRFNRILSSPQEEESLPPRETPVSPLNRLPRVQPASSADSQAEVAPESAPQKTSRMRPSLLGRLPAARVKPQAATQETPVQLPAEKLSEPSPAKKGLWPFRAPAGTAPVEKVSEGESGSPSRKMRFGPAFWTIASALSLIVNIILIVIVIVMLGIISRLNLQIGQLMTYAKLPESTVKGLYENFVKMDQAHIRTQIPVSAEIPVKFDLDLNTQTDVVLTQDTPINKARVTLTTGGLNITNAPANIILPAGTHLPVTLTLTVPVDKTVPVQLIVPVDIALSNTDLHEPFVGLQTVVQPLYCLLDSKAMSPSGTLLCQPTSTP